ncbi:MAG TPA: hypothetical protein VF581_07695 [Flavobacterium sp.]|jgi:hypothetical protein
MNKIKSETGSLGFLLQNIGLTFWQGRGIMHLFLGLALLNICLSFFAKNVFIPNETYDVADTICFYIFFPAGCFVVAGIFGCAIEDRAQKWFGAIFDYNDVWWTAFSFLPAFILYCSLPVEYFTAMRWINIATFVIITIIWIILNFKGKKYEKATAI